MSNSSSRVFDQASGHKSVLWAMLGAAGLVACSGEPAGASAVSSGGAAGLPAANGGTAGTPAAGAGGSQAGGGGSAAGKGSGGAISGATGGSAVASGGSVGNGGSVANGGSGGGSPGAGGGMPAGGGAPAGGAGGASGGGGSAGGGATFTDADTLVPHASWDCGMPAGIPPPSGDLVLEATAQVGEVYDLGQTQYGHRYQTEIKGGTVTGPKIKGTLMDRGLDYELNLSNGAVELEEINILKTSDGVSIYLRTCGTAPGPGNTVRIVPDFEAPNAGAYAFLNTAKLVGTRELDKTKKTLKFTLYSASTAAPARTVTVADPDGVPDQTWECKKAAGTKGAVVYTESVGIGAGSVAVGASKRGTRNIIPITGGTTSGRIAGTVLSGGADYQLIGTAAVLDARYTIKTNDGELIIVRNCGPIGALVPVFEAATAGKYAFINANTWLSSDPGVGAGVVNLTIYEGGR